MPVDLALAARWMPSWLARLMLAPRRSLARTVPSLGVPLRLCTHHARDAGEARPPPTPTFAFVRVDDEPPHTKPQ